MVMMKHISRLKKNNNKNFLDNKDKFSQITEKIIANKKQKQNDINKDNNMINNSSDN
jgi:cytochrome c556